MGEKQKGVLVFPILSAAVTPRPLPQAAQEDISVIYVEENALDGWTQQLSHSVLTYMDGLDSGALHS